MFKPVSPKPSVQAVEEAQLEFWRKEDIFQRTMRERSDGPRYVFYEGPPTANGQPGSHHVLARAFKDMFPRYKTMNGYYCLRKGGWDTHGLPVEIEVEKELNLEHKHEIEAYGIAEFNAKCKESVFRYIKEWEELTERIAFWVDLDEAYVTFTNDYIQSVWWILRQYWDQGLLYQGYKVVPYCARCGTPLSSHEVNLGYRDDTPDPSIFVRFKVKDTENTYFLVWTTTPWTLPGNVALAVGEDVDYVKVEGENEAGETEHLILAYALLDYALEKKRGSYEIVEQMKGVDLVGMRYEPLYTFLPTDKDYAYVVDADFVSIEEGTGIVHMAPAFGAEDLVVGQEYDLPVLMTVNPQGAFIDQVTPWAGMWVKDADSLIIEELESRGLMFRSGTYYHTYPFCWRCGMPLLYYARRTWYIRTTERRENLVNLNKTINWVPEHVRDGRFGKWLEGNVDWALGRERYWGTPLPVWQCDNAECGHQHCIGGVDELGELSGEDQSGLDLHRPFVDEITWPCRECGKGTMRRVPELIDVWFDSGSMPVAQWGYPYYNQDMFKEQFPADYICEAVDQTRGWFYSLHAISTLLFDEVCFENCICLGHILDGNGEKMSKSKGNVVEPWDVIDRHGADMFRWYMYTAGPPGDSRRFSEDLVGQSVRTFWLTLWHIYRLFVEYANIDNVNPLELDVPVERRDAMDRWILARLHVLVRDVTQAYETYDATGATRPVERFVIDELSNWYVRRSKHRFWKSENDEDKAAAYLTLYECLVTVGKLLAPTAPFMAEEIYRNLVTSVDPEAPISVHLARWPEYDEARIDEMLIDEMQVVLRLASLGLSARNSAGIKVRQPLAEAAFSLPSSKANVVSDYADVLTDELNVKAVRTLDKAEDVVTYSLNPLPQELGPRFGKDFPRIQKMLREGDATDYARRLLAKKDITVRLDGEEHVLTPQEVEVRSNPAEGYAVAEDIYYLVAISTVLTDDLAAEGLARDFIRRVQELRKAAEFEVDDRIAVTYKASDKLARAVVQFADLIKGETLANTLEATEKPGGERTEEYTFEGETLLVGVKRL